MERSRGVQASKGRRHTSRAWSPASWPTRTFDGSDISTGVSYDVSRCKWTIDVQLRLRSEAEADNTTV